MNLGNANLENGGSFVGSSKSAAQKAIEKGTNKEAIKKNQKVMDEEDLYLEEIINKKYQGKAPPAVFNWY